MASKRIAFFNGGFIEEEQVSLHVSDLAIQRGYGVFDYFRTVNNVPVFLEHYLDRFARSAATMRLDMQYSRAELISIIEELISRNDIASSGMRMELTGGYSPDSYEMGKPNFFIIHQPLKPRATELVEKGMKIITHSYVRDLPQVKSINYLMGVWLQEKVRAAGASDVLYHLDNEVSEFARSNFFIVTQDDVVATPSKNVLHGITRMKTLELARQYFSAEERPVTIHDIRECKEAFMTSTTKQIIPIVQADGITVGNGKPGDITRALDEKLQKLCLQTVTATQ
jgi:branched-chain amino acid aminotransferase